MYVTLNISATSLRLLSVKGRHVQKWGDAPLASGLVRDGLILQPKAVGAAIDALFKSTKVPKEQVIITLTGLSFTYRILNLPRMKPALLEEAILRGAKKEIPLPLEELYLSWQAIGSKDDELNFFVVGVPRNLIDAVVQTLIEAGVKPYIMDLKPLALARAANQGDALIVSLEPDCFDIVLVANGIPAIMHTITPRGEGASLDDNIRRVTDELSKTVKFYNSSHPENLLSPTTPLLLTGELSSDATTSKLIQAEIGYPVEPLIPPVEFPSDLPIALYAANVGLALKKVSKKTATRFHDINLNILSAKYKTRARPVSMRNILLPLALIIVVGLLFPMYQLKSQADAETTRLQTEFGRVGQELHQVRLAFNEAEQIEEAINEIAAEVETLKQEHQYILGKGGDFANNLKLVTNALPSEAYFTSIEIGTDQLTVAGEADSSFGVVGYAMALEAQERFSEVRIAEIDEVIIEIEVAMTENAMVEIDEEITEIEVTETERTMTESTGEGTIVVGSGPHANFSAKPISGEEPLTVQFTDLSISVDGIVSWLWRFGDGETSTEQNPTHTYSCEGIYTVSLTVWEGDGDSNTIETKITKTSFIIVISE